MNFDPVSSIADVFSNLIGLGKSYIDDKQKAAEFAEKAQEAQLQFNTTLITTHTVPWVDAACKLLYVLKEFWRPVVSSLIFFYGITHPEVIAKMHELGTPGDAGIVSVFGAFPGWMTSRHILEAKKDPL